MEDSGFEQIQEHIDQNAEEDRSEPSVQVSQPTKNTSALFSAKCQDLLPYIL